MEGRNLPEPGFIQRGVLLGGGLTGIVELLPNGHVLKTPWPTDLECHADIRNEAKVYQRLVSSLGQHVRFINLIAFDEQDLTLMLEYMPNLTLREYLRSNTATILPSQRYKWVEAIAEGVELLHSLDIVHCDLTPHNIFLDANLELKIGDFSCSQKDGSVSAAGTNARFYPQRTSYKFPVTKDDDLFALGSCVYEVLMGEAPFEDVASPAVTRLVRVRQFPDLLGLGKFGDVVRDCWLMRTDSAGEVYSRIKEIVRRKGQL